MELSRLKLVIVQGPREGDTFEFPPGSTAQVGRIVRGNKVAIKDAGISSKHLVIGSESGKWTVQDLDSSNGTFLNSSKLSPFETFDLHCGDTLKLGEYTSILVQFEAALETTTQLRRNPRRQASSSRRTQADEENRGRTRRARALETIPEKETVSVRVTRGRRKKLTELPPEIKEIAERDSNLQVERVEEEDSKKMESALIRVKVEEIVLEENRTEEANEGEVNERMKLGEARESGNLGKVEARESGNLGKGEARESGNLVKVEEEVDLERMKLGEWFDYMAAHLQKEIIEATEGLIEGMVMKAKQVQEYMVQQKKERVQPLWDGEKDWL